MSRKTKSKKLAARATAAAQVVEGKLKLPPKPGTTPPSTPYDPDKPPVAIARDQ